MKDSMLFLLLRMYVRRAIVLFPMFLFTNLTLGQSIDSTKIEGKVFDTVEVIPNPPGGMIEFHRYIQGNLRYPENAKSNRIEGKVFVQFIVNKYGFIGSVRVIKGIGGGCDVEALRLMRDLPKWQPGTIYDEPVNVRMILPIVFTL